MMGKLFASLVLWAVCAVLYILTIFWAWADPADTLVGWVLGVLAILGQVLIFIKPNHDIDQ